MNHLLFVDDELRVLDGLRRMLRGQRDVWDCSFASGVDEALEILTEREFDLVVSDMNMPEKSGLDLLVAMRSSDALCHTPFLMLTGNGEAGVKKAVLEAGAIDFLSKPIDFIELQTRLTNVLALKTFQDEIRQQNAVLEDIVRRRTAALESSRREIIYRLAKAAETRDTDTGNHIIRVALGAMLIAKFLGLDETLQEEILLTSPLHDVGKIGISDDILRKPGPLTEAERREMQEHCRIGAEILTMDMDGAFTQLTHEIPSSDSNTLLDMAAQIAMSHHEWWNGNGYPQNLAGEEIPLTARIVAVADVYDALRSKRPYKEPFSKDEAVEIISKSRGRQFDPEIVDAFVEHIDEIELSLQPLRLAESIPLMAAAA